MGEQQGSTMLGVGGSIDISISLVRNLLQEFELDLREVRHISIVHEHVLTEDKWMNLGFHRDVVPVPARRMSFVR